MNVQLQNKNNSAVSSRQSFYINLVKQKNIIRVLLASWKSTPTHLFTSSFICFTWTASFRYIIAYLLEILEIITIKRICNVMDVSQSPEKRAVRKTAG